MKSDGSVADRLWLWGHEAGAHNDAGWGLPARSRVAPAEAAASMGISNVILVRYARGALPPAAFEACAASLCGLREVVWSVVGAGAQTAAGDRAAVIALARRRPNIRGVMMDDFFCPLRTGRLPALTLDELREVRRSLALPDRRLDLWVVLYDIELCLDVAPYLALCDKLTYWTWQARDLDGLEQGFATAERLAPQAAKVLGVYLWDYGGKRPMPLDLMERQCETGLRWLRERRIEGMIFLASCICDLPLEAVAWVRNWIGRVRSRPV